MTADGLFVSALGFALMPAVPNKLLVLGRTVATMRSLTVASAPIGALAAGALVLAVAAVTGTRLRHVND